MKKVFIISSVLLCLAGSFYVVYNFLLLEESPQKEKIQEVFNEDNKNREVSTNVERISRIAEGNIESLSLDESGKKIQYYSSSEKGFWWSFFDGSNKQRLSNDDFEGFKNAIWNQNKKEALLEIGDSFYLYSFGNEKKFIKKTKALNWINFNQKIVYTYEDFSTGKKTLNVANPDGSNWKEIATVESDDINIAFIPGSAKASFWPKPDSFNESNVSIVSVGEVEIDKVGELKFGADYLWSNDGSKFLRSSVSQKGSSNLILESCEARTGKCENMNLPTIASKCAWSKNNKNIYCAAPINMGKNVVMPNDYSNNKFSSRDFFWKVNMENGKKEKVIDEKFIKEELDASDLLISPNEDFLFFINKKDGSLFRIII
ncbi:MAG: hypothetical protein ACWGHO_05045 [Candidatus Moraniibacteriota bacterium]